MENRSKLMTSVPKCSNRVRRVVPQRSPPQEICLKNGLLVGIRVLNKAPISWGAMERVPLDSHDRARKLTWNPQHGELSLWRPLFSLKDAVCFFSR